MAYEKGLNYCTFSPEDIFGVTANYACYLHDRQYRNEVKVRKTRKEADELLRDTIFEQNGKSFKALIVSRVYYYACRIFGGRTWEKD
jgi:hypothetical protein